MKRTIAFLLALVMCLTLCACGGKSAAPDVKSSTLNAFENSSGEAFIVDDNGNALKVPGDEKVDDCDMTADRKHIVVLYEDGSLSVFDSSMENETKIASDVDDYVLRDSGIFYVRDCYAGLTIDKVLQAIISDLSADKSKDTDTKDTDAKDTDAKDTDAKDSDAKDTDAKDSDAKKDAIDTLKKELDEDASVYDAVELYKELVGKNYYEVYKINDTMVRYLFGSGETAEITIKPDADFNYNVADDNLNILYTIDDAVYSLLENQTESSKLGTKKADELYPIGISSVSGQAVWADIEDNSSTKFKYSYLKGYYADINNEYNLTYYTYADNDSVKLGEGETTSASDYIFARVFFPENGKSIMFAPPCKEGGKLITWNAEDGVNSYNLGDSLNVGAMLFTADGSISFETKSAIDGVYYFTTTDMYYLTFSADREKVISDIEGGSIVNGKLFYIKEDVLYSAELKGSELGESEKIASDVYSYKVLSDGETVAYLKDYDIEDGGQLFIKQTGKDAEKVTSEVNEYVATTDNGLLIMKDVTETDVVSWGNNHYSYGELYSYSIGKELVKISSDVVTDFYSSGTSGLYYDVSQLRFGKYDRVDDKDLIVSVFFYDGKEATNVVSDIVV